MSLLRSVLSGLPDDKEVDVSVGSLCDENCAFVDDELSTEASLPTLLVLLDEDEVDELLVVCGTVLELELDELLLDDELEEVVSRAVDDELLLLEEDDVEDDDDDDDDVDDDDFDDDDVEELLVLVVTTVSRYSSLIDVIAMPPLPQTAVRL